MPSANPAPASRRRFLKLALAGACACLPLAPLGLWAAPADSREQALRASMAGLAEGMARMLAPAHGPDLARDMAREAREAFAASLGRLPGLGPDNPNQESLDQAAFLAAMRVPMARRGLAARETGRVLYDLCAMEMAAQAEPALARGRAYFSRENLETLRQWARRTRERAFPGDWVAEVAFVGQGQDLEIHKTYRECGAFKLFQALGVAEVAPFFCLNDFVTSRAEGTGLTREHTLAQGDAVCDFRYRQGRAVTQGWDTELPLLKTRGYL
jgi:hypothetical protein